MQESILFGTREYVALLIILVAARGTDFLSTRVATPNLVLEGNPIARRLGWKWGLPLNVVLCAVFALWPVPAVVISTTSVLVAARNFQSAWLMRVMGEEAYRDWYVERLLEARLSLLLVCLGGQTLLTAVVGVALVIFSPQQSVPWSIGVGTLAYAAAVAVYTGLALWRIRRQTPQERPVARPPSAAWPEPNLPLAERPGSSLCVNEARPVSPD